MRRYAGDLIISHGDVDDDEPVEDKDFSYALLSNAHPGWKGEPGWKGHPFEDAEDTPWHPALAAILSSIGIDPGAVQEAALDRIDTFSVKFLVRRDRHGVPVESPDGLRLPENHPAITGDNTPMIFNDPRTICSVMFWDVGQANVIMLPPDGHLLFQFNDPNDEPPITCALPRIPDTRALHLTELIDTTAEDAPLLRDLIDVGDHDIGSIPIRKISQVGNSTIIEME